MTSKERAELRAQANTLQALFQVGKEGVSEGLIKSAQEALKARELIKLKVILDLCPEKPKDVATQIAEATGSDVVQVVGGSMVFYKYNPELHEGEKKKKTDPKIKPNSRKYRNNRA